jgi:hypothetical protein
MNRPLLIRGGGGIVVKLPSTQYFHLPKKNPNRYRVGKQKSEYRRTNNGQMLKDIVPSEVIADAFIRTLLKCLSEAEIIYGVNYPGSPLPFK